MNKILCFLLGHKNNVPMLNEDEFAIYTTGCSRCKMPVGLPEVWKNCPAPPNSSSVQIEYWNKYIENHYKQIRNINN